MDRIQLQKISGMFREIGIIFLFLTYNILRKIKRGIDSMMKYVMLFKDINVWFKKGDVVEIKEQDDKSQLALVYNRKNKKQMWLMYKDLC